MLVKNLMEEIVESLLDDIWSQEEMCKCPKCRADVKAMALNELKPRYLVTERGKVFSRTSFLELQNNVEVYTSLCRAVKLVKKNPHHM